MANFEKVQIKTLDKGGYTHTVTLEYPEGQIHFTERQFETRPTQAHVELLSNYPYTVESEFTEWGKSLFAFNLSTKQHKGFWAVFATKRQGDIVSGTIKEIRTSYGSDYSLKLEEHEGWQRVEGPIKLYRTEEEAESNDNP